MSGSGAPEQSAPHARGMRVAVVAAQWHERVMEGLVTGALRAIVSGSGPTVAALVPDARVATHVARALAASGLVRDTARVDGPVAGVRMVG